MNIVRCRSCDEQIVWMRTSINKNIPVNADSVDKAELTYAEAMLDRYGRKIPMFNPQEHESHFSTCQMVATRPSPAK